MLLDGKIAVIYGAAGGIGSAVARRFAAAGAGVVLAGRTMEPLAALAEEIHGAGGKAEAARLDALDPVAVARHTDGVVERLGSVDVSFNLVGIPHRHGRRLDELTANDFAEPIRQYAMTHFLTATAAARHMSKQGSGVILMLTTQPARLAVPHSGPFGAALGMIEAFARNLAAEVGPSGVRVACILSTGSPDVPDVQDAIRRHAEASGKTADELQAEYAQQAVLKRMTLTQDVADVATFLASDRAKTITATAINASCGLIPG
jgi:NAD(P)-dependent dehydrogenase (short-subunit alcohol dehydrogenase family)